MFFAGADMRDFEVQAPANSGLTLAPLSRYSYCLFPSQKLLVLSMLSLSLGMLYLLSREKCYGDDLLSISEQDFLSRDRGSTGGNHRLQHDGSGDPAKESS